MNGSGRIFATRSRIEKKDPAAMKRAKHIRHKWRARRGPPRGTPNEIIQKVYRDTKVALQSSRLKARFYVQGLAPVGNSPEEMGRAMKEETQLWARVVKERKIQVK